MLHIGLSVEDRTDILDYLWSNSVELSIRVDDARRETSFEGD